MFNLDGMNTSIKPGDDFYEHVNGAWIKKHPVPPDKMELNMFTVLQDKTDEDLRKLVEMAENNTDVDVNSNLWKIGQFYRTGMDTATIDKQDLSPLKSEFDRIESIRTINDIQIVIAHLLTYGHYGRPCFYLFASPDPKKNDVHIATIIQGGLGLPDRDYYISKDDASQKIRDEYARHVARMFTLLGDSIEDSFGNAQTIIRMETFLANASFTNVENRDPIKTYNKMSIDELKTLTMNIEWYAFMEAIGHPDIKKFNIMQPAFLRALDSMITSESIQDWKTFLRWRLICDTAPFLSSRFENESFEFNRRKLNGQEQMEPRWKRVLFWENIILRDAIGMMYVEKYFPPHAKARMTSMVSHLKATFRSRIKNLIWMGDLTKERAIRKLDSMEIKIGYPEKWLDYSNLEIENDSYVLNILRAASYSFHHGPYGLDNVGKPVDLDIWDMGPQMVNAMNNPIKNLIIFPAAILQPPFFDQEADDAINYGAIGAIIGHEMIHGFDDEGRRFDETGKLRDWWTTEDEREFNQRAELIINQYNSYQVLPDLYVNGKLTLGENIADLGGLTMAYHAYKLSFDGKDEPEKIDGFSSNQRVFLGYARAARGNIRDELMRTRVLTDVHSPFKFRVNGVVFNINEFYRAFPEITPEDRLYRAEEMRQVIW